MTEITAATIAATETLMGIAYTAEERAQMIGNQEGQVQPSRSLGTVETAVPSS
jgi:hypothetical protein